MKYCILVLSLFIQSAYAFDSGLALSYGQHVANHGNPKDVRAYRVAYWIHPEGYTWKTIDLMFDLSVAHLTSSTGTANHLSVVTLAPVLRVDLIHEDYIAFYLIGSIGPAVMSDTQLGNRNLGINFTFQDRIGVGFIFGKSRRVFVDAQLLHYSNASLSSHNMGVTVPVLITLGAKFN